MNNMSGSLVQYSTLYWPWPIAIYLFLAGLSAGAIMVSLLVKFNRHASNTDSIWDSMVRAGAVLGPVAITFGLLLLIVDLGKPLSFYLLLIKYNFGSVMSIGVMCLLLYTPLAYLYALMIFEDEIERISFLKFLQPLTRFIRGFAKISKGIEYLLFFLAICVGAYTGFLLSAISKIPLWNTPVLPLLFLVSGFSSGIAANILVGMIFFKSNLNKENIKYLLIMDLRTIMFELPVLFLLFMGIYFSNGAMKEGMLEFLLSGSYGELFWIGAIGIGLVIPVVIALSVLRNHAYKPFFIVFNSISVLVGVVLLRFYIVYAGQASLIF